MKTQTNLDSSILFAVGMAIVIFYTTQLSVSILLLLGLSPSARTKRVWREIRVTL